MGYVSDSLPASSGKLAGNSIPLVYGFNRLNAELLNNKNQILARDSVTVYRSDADKYVRILSPSDHELLASDMVSVRVSAPKDNIVTINGQVAKTLGEMEDSNFVYSADIWLHQGFNTIKAESTKAVTPGSMNPIYTKSIEVYCRKDDSIFSFVTPRDNEFFKPTATATLTIVGDINSPFKAAPLTSDGLPQKLQYLPRLQRPELKNFRMIPRLM